MHLGRHGLGPKISACSVGGIDRVPVLAKVPGVPERVAGVVERDHDKNDLWVLVGLLVDLVYQSFEARILRVKGHHDGAGKLRRGTGRFHRALDPGLHHVVGLDRLQDVCGNQPWIDPVTLGRSSETPSPRPAGGLTAIRRKRGEWGEWSLRLVFGFVRRRPGKGVDGLPRRRPQRLGSKIEEPLGVGAKLGLPRHGSDDRRHELAPSPGHLLGHQRDPDEPCIRDRREALRKMVVEEREEQLLDVAGLVELEHVVGIDLDRVLEKCGHGGLGIHDRHDGAAVRELHPARLGGSPIVVPIGRPPRRDREANGGGGEKAPDDESLAGHGDRASRLRDKVAMHQLDPRCPFPKRNEVIGDAVLDADGEVSPLGEIFPLVGEQEGSPEGGHRVEVGGAGRGRRRGPEPELAATGLGFVVVLIYPMELEQDRTPRYVWRDDGDRVLEDQSGAEPDPDDESGGVRGRVEVVGLERGRAQTRCVPSPNGGSAPLRTATSATVLVTSWVSIS